MRYLVICLGLTVLVASCMNPRQRKRLAMEAPPPPPVEEIEPTPESVILTPPEVIEPAPPVEPAPFVEPAPPVEATPPPAPLSEPVSMAILLSDDLPEYEDVATQLTRRAGEDRTRVYNLDGNPGAIPGTLDAIQASDEDGVVAIGLLAAAASRRLESKDVLFCQVFNYQDHDLVAPNRKGVSMIPPPFELIRAWKEIAPDVLSVGVITGRGHDSLIAAAREAAQAEGLELEHRVVSSDREALYEFRRLLPDIDGLWLLPDNRILSREVLREIMSYSRQYQKQVLVNTPQLLSMGGLLSATSRSADVADIVYRQLDRARNESGVPGPDLAPLTEADLSINGSAAERLGLTIPSKYQGFVQQP